MGGGQGEPLFSYKVLPVDNYSVPTTDIYENPKLDQDLNSGYNTCQPQVKQPKNKNKHCEGSFELLRLH